MNLAFGVLLLAFCSSVESGVITINFPEDDYELRLQNGNLQLFTNNALLSIKSPTSSSTVRNFSLVSIVNSGVQNPEGFQVPSDENSGADEQPLQKGTKKFNEWLNSQNLFHATDIYLFDVTDPEHVIGDSVREVGPFRFFQKRAYEVLRWSEDENYVEIIEKKRYSMIGNVTKPLNQQITVLNVPLVVIHKAIRNADVFKRRAIESEAKPFLDGLPLFMTMKIKDVLFGYKDETLSRIPVIDAIFHKHGQRLVLPYSIRKKEHTYSILGSMNKENFFRIGTGKDNIKNLGQIMAFNGYNENPAWRDDLPYNCTRFEGSDGRLRAPLSGKQDKKVMIFVPEFDRAIQFDLVPYDRTVNNGQKVRKYVMSPNAFKSSLNYAPNACVHNYTWLSFEDYDGIFSKSKITAKNQPIVFSKPNFLDADKSVTTEFFQALRPNKTRHDWFIEINEKTGQTVYEHKTVQVNFDTAPINSKIARLFFPVYYYKDYSFVTNQNYDK